MEVDAMALFGSFGRQLLFLIFEFVLHPILYWYAVCNLVQAFDASLCKEGASEGPLYSFQVLPAWIILPWFVVRLIILIPARVEDWPYGVFCLTGPLNFGGFLSPFSFVGWHWGITHSTSLAAYYWIHLGKLRTDLSTRIHYSYSCSFFLR